MDQTTSPWVLNEYFLICVYTNMHDACTNIFAYTYAYAYASTYT
jgi:hypothetical protein